jgi:hypothetical protein
MSSFFLMGDFTLQELRVESFFPMDDATASSCEAGPRLRGASMSADALPGIPAFSRSR